MKVLKIAAIVIGAVVLIATGVGVAAGFSLAASFGAVAAGAASVLGISAGLAGALLAGTALLAISAAVNGIFGGAKPSTGGSQTKWKADPYAGIPYVMGRTLTSGNIVYRRGHGTNNVYETFVTILSLGAIASIDATFMNKETVAFDGGGNAAGKYHNQIYQRTQLGASPEASALSPPIGAPTGWTAAHKLSGLAAAMNTYKYDSQGSNGLTTERQPSWIGHFVKVYDPRLDSTYPGGSGACRALDETTYVWSENPHLHGLTWALGRWQNGTRVAGIGAPVATIDVAAFVEGANLDDARSWKIGGQVYTRPDTLWNSLKAMLQAGGSTPALVGGLITCINRAPRVSLATITSADIVGRASFSGTQPRRSRINGIIPQYRSEAHDWEMVSADPVIVPAYVTIDGDERTREVTYSLVQDVHQAAELATYDICDAREAGPGSIPLKPWWINYKIGDCVTFQPEPGFSAKVLLTGTGIEAQTGTVTYNVITETDAKHELALGQTGVAPPTAGLTYSPVVGAPEAADWTLTGVSLSDGGASLPALALAGACGNPNADAVLFDYRPYTVGLADEVDWVTCGVEPPTILKKSIGTVTPGASYQVSVQYRVRGVVGARRLLGPVTAGEMTVSLEAIEEEIRSLASDDVLTHGSEKQRVGIDYQAVINDLAALDARYTTIGSPSDLSAVKSDADTAVTALTTYLTGLTPDWTDGTVDTPIDPAVFVARFNAAYEKVAIFRAAITGRVGNTRATIYIRSLARPATPTGDTPAGWASSIPGGSDTIWSSNGTLDPDNHLVGVWSTPQALPGFTPRGAYVATDTYYAFNTVSYGGGTYYGLQDGFSGQAPSGAASATAYWAVLSAPGGTGMPATPPSAFSATINLTSGAAVNLHDAAVANGYTDHSDATITFNVPSGVTIRGLPGGIGLDTGSWPTSSYAIALTLVVQNGGTVDGGGGNGGSASYGAGSAGGDAIYVGTPMSGGITVDVGGTVRGGGGGGASGYGGSRNIHGENVYSGGGGGGGGAPNGGAGLAQDGDSPGHDGSPGTTAGGGAGGARGGIPATAGAAGGTFGAAGGAVSYTSGGAAGYAVRKNENAVAVTNNGTMTGAVA